MTILSAQGYFLVNGENTLGDLAPQYDSQAMRKDRIARGQRIRLARKERGLTQSVLAKRMGIAQSAISDLERGESDEMDASTLLGFVRELEVRPEWIMHGEEPMRFTDEDAIQLLEQISRLSTTNKKAIGAAIDALLRSQDGPPTLPPGQFPLLPKPKH